MTHFLAWQYGSAVQIRSIGYTHAPHIPRQEFRVMSSSDSLYRLYSCSPHFKTGISSVSSDLQCISRLQSARGVCHPAGILQNVLGTGKAGSRLEEQKEQRHKKVIELQVPGEAGTLSGHHSSDQVSSARFRYLLAERSKTRVSVRARRPSYH